jgi:hypothetical protein
MLAAHRAHSSRAYPVVEPVKEEVVARDPIVEEIVTSELVELTSRDMRLTSTISHSQ